MGFETTTGPSGPSRSRETWHVLFSFTNERGEICDLTSNRVPHVFLKGFFFWNPPKKKWKWPKQFIFGGVFGVKKEKQRTFFWGSKNFTSKFWGREPDLDLGSTRDQQTVKTLKEKTNPQNFTAILHRKKTACSQKGKSESLPFASIFRGYPP